MAADASRLRFKHSPLLMLSFFLLALCWVSLRASAQEVTATINGTITDATGRAVANVDVTATDLDRGTVWPTKTNATGFYNLIRLPVGRYEVRVKMSGFRTAVQSPIVLQLNQIAAVDIQLVVGENTETVQVTNDAPLLQTESTEVSTVIDARTNANLPLASRNYLELTLLAPGAVTPSPSGFANGQTIGQSSRPEINGNRFTANDYVLDGMDNNQASDNFVNYAPQPDAIEEFNLISQNAPADFGNYMGGIISAAIKSGTNSFHGSVFEFFRNDIFNANQWSSKLKAPTNIIPRAKLRWNQFGGAVGGPVLRDKLFFFADYEGERFDIPTSGSALSVFSALERQGNVSELIASGKNIVDPVTKQPFPNNAIPTAELSKAALAIVNSSLYPKPVTGGLTQNAINLQHTYTNNDQGDIKIDYAMDEKDHFMGRFSDENLTNPTVNNYDFAYNSFNVSSAWNVVGGYTRTISPSMVNDARLGVNYVRIGMNHESSNFSGSAGTLFGISGLPTNYLPAIQLSNAVAKGVNNSTTVFGTKDSLNDYYDTDVQYQDVLSYTHGKHTMRFGFQGWRLRMNGFFPGNSGDAGNIQFNGQFSGSGETDFLLGLPSLIGVGIPGPDWGQRGNIFGAFFQDDWKLTRKMTVNLGFRYEDHTPWYEAHDQQDNWNPTTGVFQVAGQNGNSRALYNSYNGIGNYQPRIGIAYSPEGKTTIRVAYGLSSFMEGTGQGLRLPENPPYSKNTQANYSALAYPKTTLDQGFSNVTVGASCTYAGLAATSGAAGSAFDTCYNGAVIRVWDPKVQPAHSSQWSLFVQRELSQTATFQIGYVGQQTRHLTTAENLSQLVYQGPGKTPLASPYFAQNQAIMQQEGALPLATYAAANQNYHALQAELQARLNHGMSYLLSYTWSRCMTNSVGFFGEGGQSASQSAWWQNQYNPKADYGACYYNVKGDFTGYLIYDLPFGHGRAYGANMNKAADAVAGGWRASVIPTFRGGFPLSLGAANDEAGTGSFAPRPQCIAPPNVLHKQRATQTVGYQWFSAASYAEPAAGTFGNCSVSSVYGPGEQNIDLGLSKSFPTFHEQNVEFRAEFLNAFNHVILDSPNNGIGSNLGVISSSEGARNIQFALKYNF